MGKRQPITNPKRSYVVLKKVLKFCRVNLISFSSFLKKSSQSSSPQFNWLKWLLKHHFGRLASVSLPTTIKPVAVSKRLPNTQTSERLVSYPASRGWSILPLLQSIKVAAFRSASKLHLPSVPKAAFPIKVPTYQPRQISWLSRRKIRVLFAVVFLVAVLASGSFSYFFVIKDLPSPQQLSQREQIVTTRILDRNGEVLYRVYEDENRTLVGLADIPQDLKNATIAIEDKNFYHHHGFSITGIARAAIANTKDHGIQQGGSTITQQLVKQRLLSAERTFQRKIRELVLSVLAEFTYSKDQILEMYFNQVPYGGAAYGVEEASQRYFGKSVRELNLAESSLLAGLPAAPSVYTPFGRSPESAKYRQQEVLHRMVEEGYISQQQADDAFQQPLEFRQDSTDIRAPHFVMYVRELLAQRFGEEVVNQGGLEVTTTLDLPLQDEAQNIVKTEVDKLTRLRVSNGAALVTNPKTGEILSMVGSKDYFDFAHDGQVNVTTSERQPGSSIKPLTYATLLERGKSPNTVIDDSPITYHIQGSPPYSPQNYDGKFHGKVTIREALGSSYNIPAVKSLAEVGINTVIDKAELMGIDTWQDRKRYGLSLTLGGAEVKMTDMTELYSTFANYGSTVELNPILEVKNYKGEILYQNTCALESKGCPTRSTLNPLVAYQITDILKDNKARTPAFGPRSVLYIPNQEVAVKTGTTNNLRDNWAIGYTTDRLVAVWVGNNNGESMSYIASGVTGASPIWNNIMRLTLSDEKPHTFATPDGLIKVKVCATTGTLPCQGCPSVKEELFVPGTEPTKQCTPAWFQKKSEDKKNEPNRDRILDGAATTR
jgi:1A family penicillin-binding protein